MIIVIMMSLKAVILTVSFAVYLAINLNCTVQQFLRFHIA